MGDHIGYAINQFARGLEGKGQRREEWILAGGEKEQNRPIQQFELP